MKFKPAGPESFNSLKTERPRSRFMGKPLAVLSAVALAAGGLSAQGNEFADAQEIEPASTQEGERTIVSAGRTCGTNEDTGEENAIAYAYASSPFEHVTVTLKVPYKDEVWQGEVHDNIFVQWEGHSGAMSIPAGEIEYSVVDANGTIIESSQTRPETYPAVDCSTGGGGNHPGQFTEPESTCTPAPFTDRDSISSTHRPNVDCAYEYGIVSGFADNTFRPKAKVRRDQMASFIANTLDTLGVDLPPSTGNRFFDVATSSPHAESINRLAAAGITNGTSTHRFSPSEDVRRDQMASFLIRAGEYHEATGELKSSIPAFPDVDPRNVHYESVNGAGHIGIANGFAGNNYLPSIAVQRDHMASFNIRLHGFLTDAAAPE